MTWYLVFFSFLFCQLHISEPIEKSLSFDVVWRGKSVGTLYATKEHKASKVQYHSSTNIQITFIKTFDINYEYDVLFDNKKLQTAKVDINYNGKQHAQTQTKRENNNYQVIKDGQLETSFNEAISYSTISMYFEEPINIKRCYSEQEGGFNTITALGNHKYKKINARKKESIFIYQDGVLQKAIIDGGIVSFEMIRKQN